MFNLESKKVPFLSLKDPVTQQSLMNLKTRSDQSRIRSGYKLEKENTYRASYIHVLIAMCLAGLLGGILANLRGFFEFYREKKEFPTHLIIPFLLRPFTAMLCGLFAYFVTSVIISTTTVTTETNFIPFNAMISFLGFAIVAGFASQEFTERLKSAASIMFGLNLEVKRPEVEEEKKNDQETKDENNNAASLKNDPPPPSIQFSTRYINRD